MKIYKQVPRTSKPSAVTIGNFDGVHRGHRSIIARLHKQAERSGGVPTVVTFDPHPQKVLHGGSPQVLSSFDKKAELLASVGIEKLVVIPFNRQMAKTEPEEFVSGLLKDKLQACSVVVGANFRFGRMARGDVTMLRRFGRSLDFSFESVRLTEWAGRRVSSTEIRHAVMAADLDWASEALMRPHSVTGTVMAGAGRGKGLGFPTANLALDDEFCLPPEGVYAGYVFTGKKRFKAGISVGTNPTFGKNPLSIEAFLLGFASDLYGKRVEFEFVSFLRGQKKFRVAEDLVAVMEQDVEQVERLLT